MEKKFLKPKKPIEVVNNDENATMSDGTSLALGSAEYKEYVSDLQGLTGFEQDKLTKSLVNGRSLENARDSIMSESKNDVWHSEQAAKRAEEPKSFIENRESVRSVGAGGGNATLYNVTNQIVKMAEAEVLKKEALKQVSATMSKGDDVAISRGMNGELLSAVYNNSMNIDNFTNTIESYVEHTIDDSEEKEEDSDGLDTILFNG